MSHVSAADVYRFFDARYKAADAEMDRILCDQAASETARMRARRLRDNLFRAREAFLQILTDEQAAAPTTADDLADVALLLAGAGESDSPAPFVNGAQRDTATRQGVIR